MSDNSPIEIEGTKRSRIAPSIWSVARLSAEIRRLIEDGLPHIWIEGEVSNYKLHSSGHRYFTLKDESAQIACTMWRTRPQPQIALRDGLKVRAFGRVTVWEQGGRYQFDVANLIPAGIGDLQAAFEELKQRLNAEGLFDQARKRGLPRFPRGIGVVTSPTGAVIHDLAWGFASRFPPARIFLIPTAVQGDGAATQIAAGIESFNRLNLVDLIIVARGGGSLEDLWAFNEEVVVRAIAASRIPTVSAVGHEVDVTLSDLAADLRAPTPTGAAALVTPDRQELLAALTERRSLMERSLARSLSRHRERLEAIRRGYGFRRLPARVSDERQRLDSLQRSMELSLTRRIEQLKMRLDGLAGRIEALSPDAVLRRGFSVVRHSTGPVVRSSGELEEAQPLSVRFASGGAEVRVVRILNEQ